MKKEKIEENSNEKYLDEDTKKMKKKFKSLKSWADLIEGVMLVPVGIIIIFMIGIGIYSICNNLNYLDEVFCVISDSHEEGTSVTSDEIIDIVNYISGANLEYEYSSMLVACSGLIAILIDYITVIFIFNYLSKIFSEVEKEETPFTEKNIKYITRINILSCILFAFGIGNFSMGLVSLIIIAAITYIFKHGYKLQQQVDETI